MLKHFFEEQFDRFDYVVLSIVGGLILLATLIAWRGDQVGVQIVSRLPAEDAAAVSTESFIRVMFDHPMLLDSDEPPLTLSPEVDGVVEWQGSTLTFIPTLPLDAETTYTVSLAEALEGQRGQAIMDEAEWRFTTRRPEVLYLAPDEAEQDQIFRVDPITLDTSQLTEEPSGVFDFSLSPDGTTIAYAALREDGGSDLRAIDPNGENRRPLLDCQQAVCSGVVFSPDGRRIIYERRNFIVEGAAPGPPRLWWLNPSNSDTTPVFEDTQVIGYGASWSPDGQWLSYVTPNEDGIQMYQVNTGESVLIPSRMGGIPVWSPIENELLLSDIQTGSIGFATHLLLADPESGDLTDISGDGAQVEDSSPAWSPDGSQIAMMRKAAGTAMGKQLWLMAPDGSNPRALTEETDMHHGLPSWSPDGRWLVFQRLSLKEIGARPGIWLVDTESGRMQEIARQGGRPVWLP